MPASIADHLRWILLSACVLGGVAGGCAGGPEPVTSDRDSTREAVYLQRYVLLICIGASYEQLPAEQPTVVRLLQDEAWVFVEKGTQGPETYERLHAKAHAAGAAIPPLAAVRGCLDWTEGQGIREEIRRAMARSGGP